MAEITTGTSVSDVTKSEAGFFKGLIDSKKFGLTGSWVAACLIAYERATAMPVAVAALAAGTLVICVYTAAQAYLESKAVK